jgi:membrane-bound ClpP family serine protease
VRQTSSDPVRRAVLYGWLLAALGIVLQIAGGWAYPLIPPGLLIALAAAGAALVPWRWAPVLSVVAGAFLLFGFVATGDYRNLVGAGNAVLIAGKWLLPVGVLAGTAAAVTSLVRPPAGRLALES